MCQQHYAVERASHDRSNLNALEVAVLMSAMQLDSISERANRLDRRHRVNLPAHKAGAKVEQDVCESDNVHAFPSLLGRHQRRTRMQHGFAVDRAAHVHVEWCVFV
ncbi:Uncharacterized protein PBTT_03962 [Plasmodiophora brassicae]